MSDFIDTNIVKTRKEHRCEWCGEPIPKGSTVTCTSGRFQDHWMNYHMHDECEEAMHREGQEYGYDEGFDPFQHERGMTEWEADDAAIKKQKEEEAQYVQEENERAAKLCQEAGHDRSGGPQG